MILPPTPRPAQTTSLYPSYRPSSWKIMVTPSISLTSISLPSISLSSFSSPGESHFNASQQPYLYFQVLLLTAQFEAVSSQQRQTCLFVSVSDVHVAISLHPLFLPPPLSLPPLSLFLLSLFLLSLSSSLPLFLLRQSSFSLVMKCYTLMQSTLPLLSRIWTFSTSLSPSTPNSV